MKRFSKCARSQVNSPSFLFYNRFLRFWELLLPRLAWAESEAHTGQGTVWLIPIWTNWILCTFWKSQTSSLDHPPPLNRLTQYYYCTYKDCVDYMIFLFVRVPNRELCGSRIIPISFSDSELSVKYKHVLLAFHQFFDICSTQGRTLGFRLLI